MMLGRKIAIVGNHPIRLPAIPIMVTAALERAGSVMDEVAVQLFQDLPADMRERGWQLSLVESAVEGRTPPWHRAVYSRPFVDCLARLDVSWPVYDKRTRHQIVRISTYQDRSATWEDARQDAIRRMREVDARVRAVK